MKDFQSNQLASPPILSGFSMDDLRNQNFSSDFKMVPCHSQHVERFVALTSIAGANAIGKSLFSNAPSFAYCVCHINNVLYHLPGHTQRHHWILNKVRAVQTLPIGSTKEDVLALIESNEKVEEARKKQK